MISLALGFGAVISVLAFGGVEPLGFAPAQVAVLIAAVAEFWKRGCPRVSRITWWALGILVIIPVLQLAPLPDKILSILSPARMKLARQFPATVSSFSLAPVLTINSYETQASLLRLVCYLLTFLLAFQNFKLGRAGNALPRVLIGLGVFEASYGLFQYLTGWQYIFTYAKRINTEAATGTYINTNHYAGLLEMALPFLFAGICFPILDKHPGGRGSWKQIIAAPLTGRWVVRVFPFALVFAGLVFSYSRMGLLAGLAGLLVVGFVSVFKRGKRPAYVIMVLVLALPLAYSAWIGLSVVFYRFNLLVTPGYFSGEQLRPAIWKDTLQLIQDYPVFGTGLGTYRWSSLHYQTVALNLLYDHAHNDYLEFAADLGIPAAVLLFGGLWVLVVRVGRRAVELEHSKDRIVAAGCAGAMTAILIHSITDFNLQIPANAYIFSWIAGTAAALVSAPREPLTPKCQPTLQPTP